MSVKRQCQLLYVNRSTLYYEKKPVSDLDVILMNEIRDIWSQMPFYGYRRITRELRFKGYAINRKRVQRLMQLSGIRAIYPKPKTSIPNKSHEIYPYLLKGLDIKEADQIWSVDITYLKMKCGVMYLVALIDVYSRFIVDWTLVNTLEAAHCVAMLKRALAQKRPQILNSDQGCQFTSEAWINTLKENGVQISMDGKNRCLDNIYMERFWRSLKYEDFYLNDYQTVPELREGIKNYIDFYNHKRWHQSLNYETPASVYFYKEACGAA